MVKHLKTVSRKSFVIFNHLIVNNIIILTPIHFLHNKNMAMYLDFESFHFRLGRVNVDVDNLPLLVLVFLDTTGELVPLIAPLDTDPFTLEVNFFVALAVVGFMKLKLELGVALLVFIGLPGDRTDAVPLGVDEDAIRIGLDLATEVVVIVVILGDDIVVRSDPFLDMSVRLWRKEGNKNCTKDIDTMFD